MSEIHEVNHKFRSEIIVPLVAIHNNVSFLDSGNKDDIITADGITCEVISKHEVHICRLDGDIQRLYGCTAWEFMQRWYKYCPEMSSMWFVKMILVKKKVREVGEENNDNN